ncbi:MAG: glutathione S-transferase [Proteobacteria bacterium]|nr:glutathione S-transferase [Pseudomonadota bacterium]
MIKLYRHALSGHSHRVELFLSLLKLEYTLIDVDLMNGEHKSDSFLKLNPFGQVPVIDDNGTIIYDSNAILVYLAEKYGPVWYSSDSYNAAKIQQWLSVAAGPIASGPATARLITVFGANYNADEVIKRSHDLLTVINTELKGNQYLTGTNPTIADIAAYTYIAHAPEGNVSLKHYAHINSWLRRVESLEGFVDMQATKIGLAA